MTRTMQKLVIEDLITSLKLASDLSSLGNRLVPDRGRRPVPNVRRRHSEAIMTIAFLQGFLAWEQFLEQSFILYLLGKTSPSGYRPRCYVDPKSRAHARNIVKGTLRYPNWADHMFVITLAKCYFHDGKPYTIALQPRIGLLQDIKTLRNAITHVSAESWNSFQSLVRNELNHFPSSMTTGRFLGTLLPSISPSVTFLQYYLNSLNSIGNVIIN